MVTEENTSTPADAQVRAGDTVRASWPVSLDELQKNISHCTQESQELMSWCFLWCIDDAHPYRMEEFANRVGVDKTTIFRIVRGTYLHHETKERIQISSQLERSMAAFRKLELERAQGGRTVFVMTPTAKKIHNACDLARESQSPVFVYGPSHMGKTWSLINYTQSNNHGRTIYVRLQAASGLGGMVRAIASGLGISDKQPTAKLIERIKRALRPNMLLIIDEAHQLRYTYRKESFFACLEVLREFYDEAQCGMVICGTNLLLKSMTDNRGELEQLIRRGVHRCVLADAPTKGDVTAILAEAGLELPDKKVTVSVVVGGVTFNESPYEMIRQIGRDDGLKAITERLRYGQKIMNKAKAKALSWDHVVRAHFIIRQNAVAVNDWN
jgi:DNA transposition AAA+ family ATPase